MQKREYKFTLTEENKSKVEQFLKLLNIDTDIVEAENVKEEQPKEKEEWPKYNDKYYAIISCGIDDFYWKGDMQYDMFVKSIGNCFKTREEAEFEIERLKVLAEMKKFAEPEDRKWNNCIEHWYPYYDFEGGHITYCNKFLCKSNDIYFESREKVKKCVEVVGEDRIKKYYLRVKE